MSSKTHKRIDSGLIEEKGKLIDFELPPSVSDHWQHSQCHLSAMEGNSKGAIRKMGVDPHANYIFMRTSANPEAVEALEGQVSRARDRFTSKKAFLQMYDEGQEGETRELRFDRGLLGAYYEALTQTVPNFARTHYASYDLVQGSSGLLGMPPESVYWPRIHIFNQGKFIRSAFEEIVGELNEKEAQRILKRRQGPQNYRIGEIDFLRSAGIDPLVVEPRDMVLTGAQLIDALDFLDQFTYVEELVDHRMDD